MSNDSCNTMSRRSKVSRLIDEYELSDIGNELEHQWTAAEDRMSLRDLADYFNVQVLTAAMDEQDVSTLAGEPDTVYEILTEDTVSSADKTRIRRRLEREGVDVDKLLNDFVSYQAVRTYLKSDREVEYERSEVDRIARESNNIRKLRGRTLSVTESKLSQLKRSGDLKLGTYRTLVDIRVVCQDCGSQYSVTDLLDRGGCDCKDET